MARVGAARIFFDVVGTFQASRLIKDSKAKAAVMQAIWLDTLGGIAEGAEQVFNQVTDAVEDSMEAFFAYENQLARVRKFYQGSPEEVERFSESALALGEAFAFTGEEALKASARTAQLKAILGSQEAIVAGTEAGLMMAAVGEMETELGMNRLINLAQQTNMFMGGLTKATYDQMSAEQQAIIVTQNTTHALDQLNTVENSSVATMEDITFVLNQFASQAHIAGENIAEMSAKAALLLETGEEVSRAGTGLRMIYQRLGVATGDAAQAVAEAVPEWDAATVTTKSLTDVLEAIQPAYENMTAEQKRQFAIQIAGARHYIKFLKLMENHERLTELTTDAVNKQYDAQGDFNMIAETSAFKMKQLEARVFNLKSAIGEELAPAYVDAYRAQEIFLEGMLTLAESDVGKKVAGGILTLAVGYNSVIKPISEMYLKIANLIIALRTYQAVQRSLIQQQEMQTGAYMNSIAAEKLWIMEKERAVQIQGFQIRTNQQWTKHLGANLAKQAMSHRMLHEEASLRSTQLHLMRQKMRQDNANAAASEFAAFWQRQELDIIDQKIIKTGQEISAEKARERAKLQALATEATAYTHKHQAITMNNMLASNEANFKQAMVTSIKSKVSAMQQENQALTTQFLLLVPLTEAQEQKAIADINSLRTTLGKKEAELSWMNTQFMSSKATDEEKMAILELIDAKTKDIQKTREMIVSIEARVIASKELVAAQKQAEIAAKTGAAAMAAQAFSAQNATLAMKSFKMGVMGAAMILPFFVDQEEQMNAMFVSMAVMTIPMVITMIGQLSAAAKGLGVTIGVATGGISILIGIVATWAAMQVDWFGGKDYSQNEPADKLAAMNEELFTMAATLNEIKGLGSDAIATGWLADELGVTGMDWNMIRSDAAAAEELWNKTSEKYETLEAGKKAADKAGQTDMAATFQSQMDEMADVYKKAKAAHKLHQDQKLAADMKYWSDTEVLAYHHGEEMVNRVATGLQYSTTGVGTSRVHYGIHEGTFGHGGVYDAEGGWDAATYSLYGWATDAAGWQDYDTSGDILERQYAEEYAKLYDTHDEGNQDIIAAYRQIQESYGDYYKEMTEIIDDGTDSMVEALVQGNTSILAETEAFENNREELFWGSRDNITGQLYKKVIEGGVESLLMKTELLQTNNFYGLTMDDAVTKVTDGVMQRLALAGVA